MPVDYPRRRRRTRTLAVVIAVAVLVAAMTTLVVRHVLADREADRYRPLEIRGGAGTWFAPDTLDHLAGQSESLHLAGPAGTEQRVMVPLYVNGSHDVRITGITGQNLVARVQWSKYVFKPGSYVSGEKQPWHDFPTTAKADEAIRLGIVLRKPSGCGSGLSHLWSPLLTVHWQALGRTHTDYLEAVFDSYTLYGCG